MRRFDTIPDKYVGGIDNPIHIKNYKNWIIGLRKEPIKYYRINHYNKGYYYQKRTTES